MIFKIPKLCRNTVGRTPPYSPEVQPMEIVWARTKGRYGARYEVGGVREYIAAFTNSVEEEDLYRIVAHFDRSAESMVV